MSFLIDPPWLYANGRAIARTDHPAELAYWFGHNPCRRVVAGGCERRAA